MTDRQKDILWLAGLLVLLVLFYSKILFTGKIIRAPDIINESYWGVIAAKKLGWREIFSFIENIKAAWSIEVNSGITTEGGNSPVHLMIHLKAINYFIPAPACVGWTIVLNFFFGACGLYFYCRTISCSRSASFIAALIFALSTEMASLINAGHVMKIATIVYAPWAFYFMEKGFITRRIFWFMATGFVLAIQFFNSHWQIAYYTCLSIGVYATVRSIGILIAERADKQHSGVGKLFAYNLVILTFFLSTVSIALFPLANWSKDTNRGVQSGANQGKGGLNRDEAMMWSLPPEEIAAFAIPGFFGFSRQEAGANPTNIESYYWGRMVFTQTLTYMGLLPWLLLPLPLIFRRDKYSLLAVIGIAGGIIFSMGKYTPIYNLLYDFFPGIDRFRVPKMMMFIPVMGLGVLAARGLDLLMNEDIRATDRFKRYAIGITAVPVVIVMFLGILQSAKMFWMRTFIEMLSQPTRYEQGVQLVTQRWNNLITETAIAAGVAILCAIIIVASLRIKRFVYIIPVVLMMIYAGEIWRVNNKFMFLVDPPEMGRATKTPVMEFIGRDSNQYRTLPISGGDPMHYVINNIPVLFTSFPVQQARWQDYLDNINLLSSMPDMMNLKYLVLSPQEYERDKQQLDPKYQPVFQSPDGLEIVLENRTVLPKAWLVPSVFKVSDPKQSLAIMQSPGFDPHMIAIVESPPPVQLPNTPSPANVEVARYEGERITLNVKTVANSLLVLGEKYYRGWKGYVDGEQVDVQRVNYIQRGVYLQPGSHKVEFIFDPLPFKIGKWITFGSFFLFALMLIREWRARKDQKLDV